MFIDLYFTFIFVKSFIDRPTPQTIAPACEKPEDSTKPIPLEAPVTTIILFFTENKSSM